MRWSFFERNTTASQQGTRGITHGVDHSRQRETNLERAEVITRVPDRPLGRHRAGNRHRESRAAVARMKYFGTCEIGAQQARDKRNWRCAEGIHSGECEAQDRVEVE
jgi:hypothetical protein